VSPESRLGSVIELPGPDGSLDALLRLINRGGEKISPLEIDSALLSLDGVGEAVCFGVPDDKYGEVVWAALVPKGSAKLATKQIQKDLESKLAKFKIPERIFVVESIPK
jgi:acyl-CoA synthetase (AMP-forming)/AMP-acid ligase II